MRKIQVSLGLMMLAGVVVIGCGETQTPPAASVSPATMPSATATPLPPTMPATMPAAKTPPPPVSPATHMLTADEPYFATEPAAGAKPDGMLKAGSKVLLVIPGAQYSQITTDTGLSVYLLTDGLKALGK